MAGNIITLHIFLAQMPWRKNSPKSTHWKLRYFTFTAKVSLATFGSIWRSTSSRQVHVINSHSFQTFCLAKDLRLYRCERNLFKNKAARTSMRMTSFYRRWAWWWSLLIRWGKQEKQHFLLVLLFSSPVFFYVKSIKTRFLETSVPFLFALFYAAGPRWNETCILEYFWHCNKATKGCAKFGRNWSWDERSFKFLPCSYGNAENCVALKWGLKFHGKETGYDWMN